MAKGNYEGIVVGGKSWSMDGKDGKKYEGYSYLVLLLDEKDEKTGLHQQANIVFVGTPDKKFDASVKYGTKVKFSGEMVNDYYFAKDGTKVNKFKMKYSGLQVLK